jgi:Acetyltransferase (GNAT) domain
LRRFQGGWDGHGSGRRSAAIECVASDDRHEAARRWRGLERDVHNTAPMSSWPWVETWVRHFGDVPHYFAFGVEDGRTIGAALVTTPRYQDGRLRIPSIFLGTAGEPRHETIQVQSNRLLVSCDHLESFAQGLMGSLARARHWEQLVLQRFVPDHAHALMRGGQAFGMRFRAIERRCPAFDFRLVRGDTDVLASLSLSGRHIKGLRRKLRLLDTPPGSLTCEWADTAEQAKDILRELIELHRLRMASLGRPGAFSTSRATRYYEDLIEALWPHRFMIAFRVKRCETTLSCLLALVDGSRIIGFKSGTNFAPQIAHLSPGVVAHLLSMEESRRRGYAEYDFGDPYQPYKGELSNTQNITVRAYSLRGPRAHALDQARRLRARSKPAVKRAAIALGIPDKRRQRPRQGRADARWTGQA